MQSLTTASTTNPLEFHRLKLKATMIFAVAPWLPTMNAHAESSAIADFPTKPVRWICPTSAGAGTDAAARAFAKIAGDTWKQNCIVDNRSGASGMIGLEMLAAAPPDGYTLCLMSVSQFLDGTLSQKFVFDAKKDFTPLSMLASVPLILVTNPSTNIKSLKELVAYAKANPGKLNYSSGGSGGITHFAMEIFLKKSGIKVTHVPYKGSGPAIADLLAGHVQLSFSTPATVMPQIKAGRLNGIAVASESSSELTPGLPTFTELGLPGLSLTTWYGLFGPANMPAELTNKISTTIIQAAKPRAVQEKLIQAGLEPVLGTSAELTKVLSAERDQWANIAKEIGFKREG
ncbi:MAG: tripartite tricarboxylate transporter substrate binding protein [Polaromonas sp.]|nr:tripartite tricarboxylate transporter substrate binding protein [Polaromonas sp.]